MKLTETELAQLYRQHTAAHPPAACPSAETLTQAAMGELTAAARSQVADHLGACPTCGEEYQLIRSMQPWAAQAAAQLQEDAPQVVITPEKETVGWLAWLRSLLATPMLPYTAVAALLLVTLSLGYQLLATRAENEKLLASARGYESQVNGAQSSAEQVQAELQRTREQLDAARQQAQTAEAQAEKLRQSVAATPLPSSPSLSPQTNVHIVDLLPRNAERGAGADTMQQLQIPATSNALTLILNVAGHPDFAAYRLVVVNQQGGVIYQGRGLQKTPENTFTLALPRRLLPAGQYRFRLMGVRDGEEHLVQEYLTQLGYK